MSRFLYLQTVEIKALYNLIVDDNFSYLLLLNHDGGEYRLTYPIPISDYYEYTREYGRRP